MEEEYERILLVRRNSLYSYRIIVLIVHRLCIVRLEDCEAVSEIVDDEVLCMIAEVLVSVGVRHLVYHCIVKG